MELQSKFLTIRSNMEMQAFFNIAVAIAGFLGGWELNNISRTLNRLDEDLR